MWWALVRRDHVELGPAGLVAYGHYGRPVLVFPSERGRAWDFENNGMVDAVADLIDSGRVKLCCVDSGDRDTWSNRSEPIEERARRHGHYEQWIMDRAVPWIAGDCGGPTQIVTLGCSLGAYHAANLALRHAEGFEPRTRRLGIRHSARLAIVARPATTPPAAILLRRTLA
jgi:esterase/lipase superfamily enzyme